MSGDVADVVALALKVKSAAACSGATICAAAVADGDKNVFAVVVDVAVAEVVAKGVSEELGVVTVEVADPPPWDVGVISETAVRGFTAVLLALAAGVNNAVAVMVFVDADIELDVGESDADAVSNAVEDPTALEVGAIGTGILTIAFADADNCEEGVS